jgi:hypothetical protein
MPSPEWNKTHLNLKEITSVQVIPSSELKDPTALFVRHPNKPFVQKKFELVTLGGTPVIYGFPLELLQKIRDLDVFLTEKDYLTVSGIDEGGSLKKYSVMVTPPLISELNACLPTLPFSKSKEI